VKEPKTHDPLGPLDAITRILAGVLLTFLTLGAVAAIVDDNASVFGMDRQEICIEQNFSLTDDTDMVKEMRDARGIRKGMTVFSNMTNVCDPHPGLTTVLLAGLKQIPTALVFIAFLLLTRRTIKYARRNGLFSPEIADRIERLGWLLLLGLLGAAVIEWLADGFLVKHFLTGSSWSSGSFGISIPGIIGAYGLVSIGRVMNRAAALQTDLEGTV
jgi:hypothetical protein